MAAPVRQRRRRLAGQGCCQGRPDRPNRQQQLAAASQKPNRQTRAKTHWPRRAWVCRDVHGCALGGSAGSRLRPTATRARDAPARQHHQVSSERSLTPPYSFIVSSNFPLRSKEQPSPRQERWTWWSLPDVHKYRTGQPRASILPCLCLAGCSGSSFLRVPADAEPLRRGSGLRTHPPNIHFAR